MSPGSITFILPDGNYGIFLSAHRLGFSLGCPRSGHKHTVGLKIHVNKSRECLTGRSGHQLELTPQPWSWTTLGCWNANGYKRHQRHQSFSRHRKSMRQLIQCKEAPADAAAADLVAHDSLQNGAASCLPLAAATALEQTSGCLKPEPVCKLCCRSSTRWIGSLSKHREVHGLRAVKVWKRGETETCETGASCAAIASPAMRETQLICDI